MESKTSHEKRVFTIELKSKRDLKNVNLTNGSSEGVFLEGTIGELVRARFEEGVILEVEGNAGVLRVDLKVDEITKPKRNQSEVKNQ